MPDLADLAGIASPVRLRTATRDDIPAVIALLAADQRHDDRDAIRHDADLAAYEAALDAIDRDPNHLLVVAQTGDEVVGTFQMSFLPGLARRGAWRAQVEAVRVHSHRRGQGLGTAMMRWAIAHARSRDCAVIQLTTNKARTDAHRFYQRLGFTASHDGMKLSL